MKYVTSVLGAAAVCALGACVDAPTAPRVLASEVSATAQVGDPPPPPADGTGIPGEPFVLACSKTNTPFTFVCELTFIVPELRATGMINPAAKGGGFVTLTSLDPRIVVSDPARVRRTGNRTEGVGTMLIPFELVPNSPVSSGAAFVDLSTASLAFMAFPDRRVVQVSAEIFRPNGDPIVTVNELGETSWWRYGVFAFDFPPFLSTAPTDGQPESG
jgi:hypothetical protein